MRTFVGAVPLSVVVLVVLTALAFALGQTFAVWLRIRRGLAVFLLFGFGLVLAATLVPTSAALEGQASSGVCDTARLGLASWRELTTINVSSLNVLLFVPLGAAVGLLPRNRPAVLVTLAAVALTFVVETIQLLLPVLGRGCQTADMVDNLLGLAIGAAIGTLARPLLRST